MHEYIFKKFVKNMGEEAMNCYWAYEKKIREKSGTESGVVAIIKADDHVRNEIVLETIGATDENVLYYSLLITF